MSEKEEPRLFLDSNVILDVIERRKNESIVLLEYLREAKLSFCTSSFAHAELVDIEQEFTHITNMLGKRLTLDEILRERRKKQLTLEQRADSIDKVGSFFRNPLISYICSITSLEAIASHEMEFFLRNSITSSISPWTK